MQMRNDGRQISKEESMSKLRLVKGTKFTKQHQDKVVDALEDREVEISLQERNAAVVYFLFCLSQTASEKELNLSPAQLKTMGRWRDRQRAYYQRRHKAALEYYIGWAADNFEGWEPVDWQKIVSMVGQLTHDVGATCAADLFSYLAKHCTADVFGGGRGDRLTPVDSLP